VYTKYCISVNQPADGWGPVFKSRKEVWGSFSNKSGLQRTVRQGARKRRRRLPATCRETVPDTVSSVQYYENGLRGRSSIKLCHLTCEIIALNKTDSGCPIAILRFLSRCPPRCICPPQRLHPLDWCSHAGCVLLHRQGLGDSLRRSKESLHHREGQGSEAH